MVAISIIIPVYNSGEYLEKCLESICAQSFKDYEAICIDDGSTDESGSILKHYSEHDSRFRVVKQDNMGAGAARNSGIKLAQGKYLAFWDSDDFFEPNALELLYRASEKDSAEICVCNSWHYYEDLDYDDPVNVSLNRKRIPDHIPFSSRENWDNILNFTNTVSWNKLFLRDFVISNEFWFDTKKTSEDARFVCSALCLATRITIVNKRLIHYRKGRSNSLMNELTSCGRPSIEAWGDAYRELRRRNCLPSISFANRVIATCAFVLGNSANKEVFSDTVAAIEEIRPENIGILLDPGSSVYVNAWHSELARLLYEADVEGIMLSMMGYYRERQLSLAIDKRKLTLRIRKMNKTQER